MGEFHQPIYTPFLHANPLYNPNPNLANHPFMDPELIFDILITSFVSICVWTILTMATDKRKTEMAVSQPLDNNDADMMTPQERASNAAILSEAKKCYVLDLAKCRAIGKFWTKNKKWPIETRPIETPFPTN